MFFIYSLLFQAIFVHFTIIINCQLSIINYIHYLCSRNGSLRAMKRERGEIPRQSRCCNLPLWERARGHCPMLIDNHQLSIVNYQLKKGGKARVSGNKSEDLPFSVTDVGRRLPRRGCLSNEDFQEAIRNGCDPGMDYPVGSECAAESVPASRDA